MAFVDNFQDFIKYQAEAAGMTREEYMAVLMSEAKKKPGPDPYHRGLEDGEVEDKEDQIKKQADMDDDDPDAYKEMPGDKEAKEKGEVKTSKATKSYNKLYGEDLDKVKESQAHDEMAYGQLERIIDYATMLRERYDNGFMFDPWMHSKITKAKSYLNSVYDALDGGDGVIETNESTVNEMAMGYDANTGLFYIKGVPFTEERLEQVLKHLRTKVKIGDLPKQFSYFPAIQVADDAGGEIVTITLDKAKEIEATLKRFKGKLAHDGDFNESKELKYIKSIEEAKLSAVHKAAKKGSYPAVIVVVQDGKVIHQEPVSTPDVAPATFNVMQKEYPKALLHLEDKTGKRLFSESVVTEGMSKSAIKKAIKVIDQQIEDEEGGDGEPLDNETLQALEQERERLLKMNESKFSPLGYAKRVISGEISLKAAMKEAGISLSNISKLIKKLDKGFDIDNAIMAESVNPVHEADDTEQKSTDRGPLDDDAMETGLKKKAEESGVPIGIIRAVMRRGLAAWKSGHRPGANQQQWGYARVNAFLTKGEGTWGKADKDLAKEVRDGGHDKKLKKA